MSDHFSGPRALAEPIVDITDLYAFPSPERSGHLVLVLNTLPYAHPSARFSDGLVYRFRIVPVAAGLPGDSTPFVVCGKEFAVRLGFSAPPRRNGAARGSPRGGLCR